jgi:hypothetical protein
MKHVLLITSSKLLAGTSYAQIGLHVGGSLIHLVVVQAPARYLDTNNSVKLGYQLGVFYQVPLNKRFSFVSEVHFSCKWMRLTTRANNFSIPEYYSRTDSLLSMSYLAVPVLLRAAFGPV